MHTLIVILNKNYTSKFEQVEKKYMMDKKMQTTIILSFKYTE